MKLQKECATCLSRVIPQIAETLKDKPRLRQTVLQQGPAFLRGAYREDVCPPWLAERVQRYIGGLIGREDLYKAYKKREMREARQIMQSLCGQPTQDLRTCLQIAALGNNLDFFRDVSALRQTVDPADLATMRFEIDDVDRLRERLGRLQNRSAVILADNAGEAFFDVPLVHWLQGANIRTVYGVKGRPFLNDITMADVFNDDFKNHMPRIMSTGCGPIIDLGDVSASFGRELEHCGILIAKGQANYECLTEQRLNVPVLFLLMAKCGPISRVLKVPQQSYIAYYWPPHGVREA